MADRPYDLDDASLDGVTGGGGPAVGKLAQAMSSLGAKKPLQDAAEQVQAGAVASTLLQIVDKAGEGKPANPEQLQKALKDSVGHLTNQGLSAGAIQLVLADAMQMVADKQKGGAASKIGQASPSKGSGFQTVAGAAGGIGNTASQAESKQAEADAKRDEASAEQQQGQLDIHKSVNDALTQQIQQIVTFVHELQEAKADQMRALTRV